MGPKKSKFETFIGVVIGAAIGGPLGGPGAFVTGALMGYFFVDYLHLKNRLRELELIVGRMDVRTPRDVSAVDLGKGVASPPPLTPPVSAETGAEIPPEPGFTLREEPLSASTVPPFPPPHPPEHDGKKAFEFGKMVADYFSSGNLVVKVGVIILFFGVAFLLRYAAERNRLPTELRLIGVTVGAIALLLTGWRLRFRRINYALVLQGGGIGILYLTVFAALRLYGFIPEGFAFVLLVALSGLSSAMAVLQDSLWMAVFSVAGGFLAPLLASTGQGGHVVLFGYYALLNAGIVGIAWFKAWRELNLVGYFFTFGIGTAWGLKYYQPRYFATTEPFLILFFLFYVFIAVLFAFRQEPRLKGYVDGTLVFGTPLVAFALQAMLVSRFEYGLALSALALSCFYLGTAWALFLKAPSSMRMLTEAFMATGIVFATIAIPLAFGGRWTTAVWALEGAAIVWVGVRQKRPLARYSGILLQIGAGVAFLMSLHEGTGRLFLLNGYYLGCVAVSLAGLFTSCYLERHREEITPLEVRLGLITGIWGLLWWFGAGFNEIDRRLPHNYQYGSVLLFMALSAVAANRLYARFNWPLMLYPALALLPGMALAFLSIADSAHRHPFEHGGIVGWPVSFALLYYILYNRDGDERPAWEYRKYLHAGALWLLVAVCTKEASRQIDRLVQGAGTWSVIAWGLVAVVFIALISIKGEKVRWPIGRHYVAYLGTGIGPVTVFAWLWCIHANLAYPGNPWPLPYLPVLNPLDIATGLTFASIGIWLVKLRSVSPEPFSHVPPALIPSIAGMSGFVWLNAILIRTLHHWAGIAFSFPVMFDSTLVQACLSVFWCLLALLAMVLAARKSIRTIWLTGAGLIAVVVVKLFTIDLAGSGTIERIVSFMSVGILLLIVGYFSPLPPKNGMMGVPRK